MSDYCIYLSDTLDKLSDLEKNSIDVIISDIPYGVKINPTWDLDLPSEAVWRECYRILKPGSFCAVFSQPSGISNLMSVMNNTDFEYKDVWIWQYQGTHTKGIKLEEEGCLFRSRIRNIFNPIFIFRKDIEGKEKDNWEMYRNNLLNIDEVREPYEGNHFNLTKKFKETGQKHLQSKAPSNTFKGLKRKGWVPNPKGREPVNIQYFPRATKKEKTIDGLIENKHETVKPISLMLWLVKLLTNNSEQVVLDPFCGTGSTGCACKLLNRKFIGIDNDETSVDLARVRIENIENIKELFDL